MFSHFCGGIVAGRLSGNVVMTGNVLLNGTRRRLDYGLVVSTSIFILFFSY